MSVLFLRGRYHLTQLTEKKNLNWSLPREPQGMSSVRRGKGGDWEDLVLGDRKEEEGDPYAGALACSLRNWVVRPGN